MGQEQRLRRKWIANVGRALFSLIFLSLSADERGISLHPYSEAGHQPLKGPPTLPVHCPRDHLGDRELRKRVLRTPKKPRLRPKAL